MESIEFFLELSGGLIILIGFGSLIGHLLKLDRFSEDWNKNRQQNIRNTDGSKEEQEDESQDSD